MVDFEQVITLSGWSQISYLLVDSFSDPIASMFFNCVVLVGFYVMIQLLLGTLTANYQGNPAAHKVIPVDPDAEPSRLQVWFDIVLPVQDPESWNTFRK